MKKDAPAPPHLTFPWNQRPVSIWRLLPALVLCVAILVGLSLLFKVAEAPPARSPQVSHSVLLLDPANPVNQSVLNRAQDRSALLLRAETEYDQRHDRSLMPLFQPSFNHFELRLKDFSAARSTPQQPRLFQPTDPALPPLPPKPALSQPTASPARAATYRLQITFIGPLARRPVRFTPPLDPFRPQDLARLRFHFAVHANGRTALALPISSAPEDRDLLPALQTALNQIRFAPEPGSPTVRDDALFSWVPTQAANQK